MELIISFCRILLRVYLLHQTEINNWLFAWELPITEVTEWRNKNWDLNTNLDNMCHVMLTYWFHWGWTIDIFHNYDARVLNWLNSSTPSASCVRQWIGSALGQIMACRLFGAKPFFWTNPGLLSIGPLRTNFSEILIKIKHFSFTKMYLKVPSGEMAAMLSRGDEL